MTEAVAPIRSRRLPFWAIIIVPVPFLFGSVFGILWFKLPSWAPEWVVEHSPWLEPIFCAVVEDPDQEYWARQRIVNWTSPIQEDLRRSLHDKRSAIRILCAQSLGDFRDRDAVGQLIALIRTDEERNCRIWAIEALGKIGDARAIPQLIQILSQEEDDRDQGWAGNALSELPDVAVAEALLPLLVNKVGYQYETLALAGRIDDLRMVTWLEQVVREPYSEAELAMSMTDRRQIKAVHLLANSPNSEGVPKLVAMLSDPQVDLRLRVFSGLRMTRNGEELDGRLIGALVVALDDGSFEIREAARLAIGSRYTWRVKQHFLGMLQSPDVLARRLAVSWLNGYGSETTISALAGMLNDTDDQVRMLTITKLCQANSISALDPLLAHYDHADAESQRRILWTISGYPYLRDPRVFPYLLMALASPLKSVHDRTLRAVRGLTLSEEQQRQVEDAVARRPTEQIPENE